MIWANFDLPELPKFGAMPSLTVSTSPQFKLLNMSQIPSQLAIGFPYKFPLEDVSEIPSKTWKNKMNPSPQILPSNTSA